MIVLLKLCENFQVEKDSLFWKERELNIKNELVDVSRRTSAVADSRMASLDVEIQKQHDEKTRIKTRLGNISKEEFEKVYKDQYSQGFDPQKHLLRVGVINQTTMLASETQEIADYFKNTMIKKYGIENARD